MTPLRSMARRPVWLGSVVTVSLLGLLGLFHQVVRSAARQGDLRRETTALQTAALFRCKALHERRARDSCELRLRTEPPDVAALRARNALTIVALEALNR